MAPSPLFSFFCVNVVACQAAAATRCWTVVYYENHTTFIYFHTPCSRCSTLLLKNKEFLVSLSTNSIVQTDTTTHLDRMRIESGRSFQSRESVHHTSISFQSLQLPPYRTFGCSTIPFSAACYGTTIMVERKLC